MTSCATCQYFVPGDSPNATGQCWRYPTAVVLQPIRWCGEHREGLGIGMDEDSTPEGWPGPGAEVADG